MHIVISGGGKVGSRLGSILTGKGHTVAVIEKQTDILEKLEGELPAGVMIIEGDGCDLKIQEDAGTGKADVFVAVTGADQDNLVSCQLAKVRFGVKRTLARVNSPKNEHTFNALGIETISSTTIICNLIEKEMTAGDVFTLHILKKGRLALVEIDLSEDHCAVSGKKIAELELPGNTVLVSLIRGDTIIVPRGNTVMEEGDRVIAVTPIDQEKDIRRILTGN